MVAGKEVVRLCEHIVRQSFGDEVCRVSSTLLNRGRLGASTLIALSGLSPKTVLTALVALCQHSLVLSNGGSSLSPLKEELYEFNVERCLLRLRWGRVLALTYERLGQIALNVVKQILLFGKLQLSDIIHACGGQHEPARAAEVTEAAISLVRQSFIHPTSPLLQVLMSDQIERSFATKRQDRKSLGESGLLRPIDADNLQSESTWEITEDRRAVRAMKEVLIVQDKPGKKKKSRTTDEFDYSLKPDILLEVNYDRYGVLIRDELIVKAAEDRWNKGAAEVVRGVLEAALDEHSDLKASRTYTSVTVNQILDKIPEKSHKYLFAGLALNNTSSKSVLEYVRHYLQVLSGQDVQPTTGSRFLSKNDAVEEGYIVELQGVCVRLRANMMMDLVRERLGTRQARVLATVAKAHHISEQMIRDCAMIPLKEARIALAELQKMSLIETSEIPKSLNAKRTNLTSTSEHHRWGMDLPRAYNAMLANVYKTLGNILQRRATEYARRKASIDREGAAMNLGGRDILMQKDQDELRELDDVVKKLTLAEERCEMVVFIIRDLPGWPTGQGSDG